MGSRRGNINKECIQGQICSPVEKQITMRAMVTGLILNMIFNFIVCELNLTTGVIPSLNVANGLLGFAEIKSWTALIQQKNIVVETFYQAGEYHYTDVCRCFCWHYF
ncbi:hypothetical protein MTR67_001412 [Solanum verrucosum]|uniref:Uncharacterized protein n=1 Tax=Solanum verrucosum TaxID=315347 RepID=A0AAF0PP84_SOLVR|nr:hypothetical protein MTR67_001412 [Solanum verrucosum]